MVLVIVFSNQTYTRIGNQSVQKKGKAACFMFLTAFVKSVPALLSQTVD